MTQAIERHRSVLKTGRTALGFWSSASGSVRQQVHDGDTINARMAGGFGVRFLHGGLGSGLAPISGRSRTRAVALPLTSAAA